MGTKNEVIKWRLIYQEALDRLHNNKNILTYQQYRTLRGQLRAGDIEGFNKGLDRLIAKKERIING